MRNFKRKKRSRRFTKWIFGGLKWGLGIGIIAIFFSWMGSRGFIHRILTSPQEKEMVQTEITHLHQLYVLSIQSTLLDSLKEEYKELIGRSSLLEKHSFYSLGLGPKIIGAENDLQQVYKKIKAIEKIAEANCPACIWARQRIDELSVP